MKMLGARSAEALRPPPPLSRVYVRAGCALCAGVLRARSRPVRGWGGQQWFVWLSFYVCSGERTRCPVSACETVGLSCQRARASALGVGDTLFAEKQARLAVLAFVAVSCHIHETMVLG